MIASTAKVVALLTIVIICLQAKYYSRNISIPIFRRDQGWTFLQRIHLQPGHLRIDVKVKLLSNQYKQGTSYDLQIAAIPDSLWQMQAYRKCNLDKYTQTQLQQKMEKQFIIHAQLNKLYEYRFTLISSLQIPTHQSYHFVLRDCKKQLISEGYGRNAAVEVELDIQNNNQHHSVNQSWYRYLLPALLVLGIAMLLFLYRQKQQQGEYTIRGILKLSLWAALISIVFKYIGFLIYAYSNGVQYNFFDFFYLLFHSSSQSITMVLLVLLALGWTVTFRNSRDFNVIVTLSGLLGLVNVVMTLLNKIQDGQHDKYHMFDTIPANIMLGFRIFAVIAFVFAIFYSINNLQPEQSNTKPFFIKLLLLGFLYMSFVPISFILIRYVQLRHRKEFMFFFIELVRFALTSVLTVFAGWKKSDYRRLSSQSFMEKAEKGG